MSTDEISLFSGKTFIKTMKKINTLASFFLIAFGIIFFTSCALIDQQTQKEIKEPPPKAVETPAELKPEAKTPPKDINAPVPKTGETQGETPPRIKAVPKVPAKKTPEESGASLQQKYYNAGMKYYSQEKYEEAKKAWQKVIKVNKRSALADKARENIKKTEQILKTLKELSGK